MSIYTWFTKRRIIIVAAVVAVLIVIGFFVFGGNGEAQETVAVAKQDVSQTVAVTGTVEPSDVVDLAFLKSGRVTGIYAKAGDRVVAGQIIAALEAGEESANLASAKARLRASEAKLEELKRGSRPEALAVAEAEFASAQVSATEATAAFRNSSRDAYTKSDDAIRFKVDQFIDNAKSNSPQLKFAVLNTQTEYNAEWGRSVVEKTLSAWAGKLDTVSTSETRMNLEAVRSYLDTVAFALSQAYPSGSVEQSDIDGWKTDVATARTNIATALTNLSSAEEKMNTANAALELEKRQLELTKAGSDPTAIAAQQASVDEALASVRNYEALVSKTVIRTPITGVVSKLDLRLGEIADANKIVSGVLSNAKFEIEANIPEADIAKLALGQKAEVTLDAYGSDTKFEAKVVSIDPGETVVDGIPTYKTVLQFTITDERIRSGMTANVEIFGQEKKGVVAVPNRALVRQETGTIVRVVKDPSKNPPEIEERPVVAGLRGTNGYTEIISGLIEGEHIIVSLKAAE